MAGTEPCPGCGWRSGEPGDGLAEGYQASAACHRAFCALTAYTAGKGDRAFIHQYAVDAYAAQHVGNGMKPIRAAFALVGLYHAVERGFDGRQVQRVHTLLARRKRPWRDLVPPSPTAYVITAADVCQQAAGEPRDVLLRAWMRDVWNAWGHEHAWVRDVCRTLLA